MRSRSPSLARWLPSFLWMGLIFMGSSDAQSAKHSSRFVEPFLRWLFHGTLSAERIEEIHYLFRKVGHLTEYAVLCVLFWWALGRSEPASSSGPRKWRRGWFAIFLAACFAASDEFHQLFVPTREASIRDVLIDTVGATLGLLAFLAVRNLIRVLHHRWHHAGTDSEPSLPG